MLDILKKLKKIEIITRHRVNEQFAGQYHSSFKGRGMNFDEVKPYVPGDDVRHIDWNVSARMNETYVKHFTEERELSVYIIVDLSPSLNLASIAQRKRDLAAEAAALLSFSATQNNDKVGMCLFSSDTWKFIPQKKSHAHVLRLIAEVLKIQPPNEPCSLSTAITRLGKIAHRKSLVFIISDFHDLNFEKPLTMLAHRHDVIPVTITDPMEEQLPDLGLCRFRDPLTGQVFLVDTTNKRIKRQFSDNSDAFKENLQQIFKKAHLDTINLHTHQPTITPIAQFFNKRAIHA